MAIQSLYEIIHWNATIIDTNPIIDDVLPKGVITELELPKLMREMDTTKRAGELGIVPRPKHFGELALSFKAKAIFDTFATALTKMMQTSATIKLTACITSDAGVTIPYTVEAKGFISELELGTLSDNGFESSYKMMAYYLSIDLDTYTLIYDPRNYLFTLNGVNLFASIKDVIDPP
jgi:phage tail tube protein FII